MNETRQAITNKAFAKFDRDGSGVINASDLRYYHAQRILTKLILEVYTTDLSILKYSRDK